MSVYSSKERQINKKIEIFGKKMKKRIGKTLEQDRARQKYLKRKIGKTLDKDRERKRKREKERERKRKKEKVL